MANYTAWRFPLQEEIRKAIVAELRKIAEENPLPEYAQFSNESVDKLDMRYSTNIIQNDNKFYIGMSEVKNDCKP